MMMGLLGAECRSVIPLVIL